MNLFDRIILTIYSFILSIVSIAVIFTGFHLIPIYYIENLVDLLYIYGYVVGIIGVAFLIVSIRFLLSGVKGGNNVKYIARQTQLGEVRISLVTLQNIAEKAVKGIEGVKEVKTKALFINDGVVMILNLVVATDIKIPELVIKVQKLVKEEIESVTGINVTEVRVYIDNVTVNLKTRVE
ncbi:MAG: alkaline shock response membrane anchor protein AmaP [Thermoanaerobacteraceae bacterium]|nr:alkaline shock response membrane anchor protein AmaP [Thermoanaerobacteraceae bacterium]